MIDKKITFVFGSGRKNKIELGDNDYNMALQSEVQKYPGQEQQIIDFYKKNPDAIRNLTAPIYEDKVVDFILEMAKVSDVVIDKDTLYQADETVAPEKKVGKKPARKAAEKKPAAKKTASKKPAARKAAAKK